MSESPISATLFETPEAGGRIRSGPETVTGSGLPARVSVGLMVKSTVRPAPAAPHVVDAETDVCPVVMVLVAEPVPPLDRDQVTVYVWSAAASKVTVSECATPVVAALSPDRVAMVGAGGGAGATVTPSVLLTTPPGAVARMLAAPAAAQVALNSFTSSPGAGVAVLGLKEALPLTFSGVTTSGPVRLAAVTVTLYGLPAVGFPVLLRVMLGAGGGGGGGGGEGAAMPAYRSAPEAMT